MKKALGREKPRRVLCPNADLPSVCVGQDAVLGSISGKMPCWFNSGQDARTTADSCKSNGVALEKLYAEVLYGDGFLNILTVSFKHTIQKFPQRVGGCRCNF